MSHMGFIVSKIGVNAETATDPNDFIFHSDYNTFKIILEATKSITLAASTNDQSFTQAHSQRFTPLVTAYAKQASVDKVFLPNSPNVNAWFSDTGIASTGVQFNYIETDATNITFNFDNTNAGTIDVDIRYFVLEMVT